MVAYQAFRQIQSRPKPPSKITKQPLTYKTRNQFAGNTARGFESHTLRQRITVILIQRNDGYFMTKNSILLTFEQRNRQIPRMGILRIVK